MSAIEPIRRVRCRGRVRDHRARAGKKRKRRNLIKFIPTADSDFAYVAQSVFLSQLKRDPAGYFMPLVDVDIIEKAVREFRSALSASLHKRTRTLNTIKAKDEARKRAEDVVRTYARIIAANPHVLPSKKSLLRIKQRPTTLKQRNCPLKAPVLVFKGSLDGQGLAGGYGGGSGIHLLRFFAEDDLGNVHRAKPDGAVRIEIFYEFVPVGEPIPRHPAERSGWHKYLRSYTKSPMRVVYPKPVNGAMLVVYWARWADATGDFSQFSKTCIARVEGWTQQAGQIQARTDMPALAENSAALAVGRRVETKYVYIQTPIAGELPDGLPGDVQGLTENVEGLAEQIAALSVGNHRALEAARVKLLPEAA